MEIRTPNEEWTEGKAGRWKIRENTIVVENTTTASVVMTVSIDDWESFGRSKSQAPSQVQLEGKANSQHVNLWPGDWREANVVPVFKGGDKGIRKIKIGVYHQTVDQLLFMSTHEAA